MDELSIKIRIADREYPMKVKRNEEERVRAAARLINEKLKSYREQFGLDDKQDLLAMTAFDCLVEKLAADENNQTVDDSVGQKIAHLNQLVSQAIL